MTVCDGFANCFCKVGSMHRWEQTASLFSFSLSFIVKPPSFIKTKHAYIEKAKKKKTVTPNPISHSGEIILLCFFHDFLQCRKF